MSLINEALRKAQNQQRMKSPGLGSGTETHTIGYAERPRQIGLMIGLGMSIVILIGLVAGLTILLLSKSGPQIVQEPATAEPTKPAIETTVRASIPEYATETASATESLSKPSTSPLSEQTPETIEKPATAAPKPSQAITDWIAQSTISGVRITTTSSKVILNNKAFVPDETVNMSLGLKVLTIEPERIILIDSNGVEYVKSF